MPLAFLVLYGMRVLIEGGVRISARTDPFVPWVWMGALVLALPLVGSFVVGRSDGERLRRISAGLIVAAAVVGFLVVWAWLHRMALLGGQASAEIPTGLFWAPLFGVVPWVALRLLGRRSPRPASAPAPR